MVNRPKRKTSVNADQQALIKQEKKPSKWEQRTVTQNKTTISDTSLAKKVTSLAEFLRHEVKSLTKRNVTKGPLVEREKKNS